MTASHHSRTHTLALAASLALIAFSLRTPITSVGPILLEATRATRLTPTGASILTTLPSFCFGVFGPLAPMLARRMGSERALLLLLVLLMVFAAQGRSYGGMVARAQQQAELGGYFFVAFAMFSVITMGLIGPVLTCTAVGSERLAKTLPVLLMTPINTWQILAGKLLSRLLAALTLLGLSLPVLALVRLLGGVELWQMAAVLCTCTTFVLSCAAVRSPAAYHFYSYWL